jgi:Domain of unknown function (DUF4407)
VRRFLIALSGARPEILDQCPTEYAKFETLGSVILITSGVATVSMWFALSSAMGVNPFVAVPGALLWGLVIMGIDRWLVTSMSADGGRRWTIAIPRLLMAVLLGSLISTPFVLRIFQSEIDAQITVIKAQRASAFLGEQQSSKVGQQVTYWRKDVANLQKVIDSGGQQPINPATDLQVESLTKQRNAELTLEQQYYQAWQCQLYGGAGCTQKGNGPLATASERSYNQAVAQVGTLNGEIQQREKELSASDTASKATRYQQASGALPGAQQQLTIAVNRQNVLQQNFDAQNKDTNGILIRLQALSQLSGKGFTLNAARLLLFLLFLMIECLPVTVKLMQREGNYAKILRVAAERELRDATRNYRSRPRTTTAVLPDADRTAARDEGVDEIWRGTKVMPGRERPAGGTAEPVTDDLDGSDKHTRLDDVALRGMEDIRAGVDSDNRGIELRYGDDDL